MIILLQDRTPCSSPFSRTFVQRAFVHGVLYTLNIPLDKGGFFSAGTTLSFFFLIHTVRSSRGLVFYLFDSSHYSHYIVHHTCLVYMYIIHTRTNTRSRTYNVFSDDPVYLKGYSLCIYCMRCLYIWVYTNVLFFYFYLFDFAYKDHSNGRE